ncbi:hypothetical protein MAPG_06647 [Magnaporthiopsis poae ATCC 64411]|uniref:Uncharacterized protein n=1 Tax=Magnaporthiopsis poae (strain ATCC 64411 / 73-15) TaxID=644358 RepID=A0A0C4E2K6_MAGP6|nr:hypothetical protein MAPG_06647 [Magnaporthiopsis poae ATCC 64411]
MAGNSTRCHGELIGGTLWYMPPDILRQELRTTAVARQAMCVVDRQKVTGERLREQDAMRNWVGKTVIPGREKLSNHIVMHSTVHRMLERQAGDRITVEEMVARVDTTGACRGSTREGA